MPVEKNDSDALMPYQLPFPAEALPEIVIPNAIPKDERIWVPQADFDDWPTGRRVLKGSP